MPSDADNLFVVMSARLLNRDLQILARGTDEKATIKLERAGANRVVSLYETGAHKMAQLLTNAQLEDFMQILTSQGDRLELAEIVVGEDAPYRGQTLRETGFRGQGILVVAHQKPGARFDVPPSADAVIDAGDTLIAFGDASAIRALIGTRRR
jgi:voltage-gated potassium channel